MHIYHMNGNDCRFNHQIKFYDTVEAGGSWLFGEPITDLYTVIKLCVTLYFIIVVTSSFMYSSSNDKYNSYWLGIYAEWILLLNTFGSILSSYITCIIWYNYKYPRHSDIHSISNDAFDRESDIELQLKPEHQLNINLHSDTDVIDPIDVEFEQELERKRLMLEWHQTLNSRKLYNISYGLRFIHKLSKMISHIGISACCTAGISYWMMVDYAFENTNDDTDWIVTILNIQQYIFIVAILLFIHFISFIQLSYFNGTLYILLFDGVFALFIILFDMIRDTVFPETYIDITFLGKQTGNDDFNFELLAVIFIFMSAHVGIHLCITFIKNIFLIQYIKILKYVEIMIENNKKTVTYVSIDKIMDPLDFEVIIGEAFEKNMMRKFKGDNDMEQQGILDDSEGSDIGYSSYDFNNNDKLKRKYQNIIKKKWNAIKNRDFKMVNTVKNMMTMDNSLLFDGAIRKDNAVKIVFGSNIHQRFDDLPAVRALTSYNPDIVIFLGNNIYVDETPRQLGIIETEVNDDTTFRHSMNSMFNFWRIEDIKMDPSTEYQRLLKHKDFILCNPDDTLPIVLATWDEHDYGGNGEHGRYQNKYHSKSAFLSFLDRIDLKHELTHAIDTMKCNTYRGIYYHYDYHHVFEKHDEEEKKGDDHHIFIRFIMLDLMFDRSDEDIFGREQWCWIRKLLENSKERKDKPDWHIFVFGTPCLVEQFDVNENMNTNMNKKKNKQFKLPHLMSPIPLKSDFQEWDHLSKSKLLTLLHDAEIAEKSLFLSGNMNYSQVLLNEDTPIYEFVSSSLTHSIPSYIPNDYYVKNEYEFCVEQTDICNVNGYGYLEVDKNGWKFCVNDANGNVHIPLSKRFK